MTEAKQQQKKIEINSETPKVYIATYGTLRLNEGNWAYRLKDKSKFVGTFKTEARFTMTGKQSGFPIVYDNGDTAIEYDLFEITDNSVLSGCHSLEGCTGIPGNPNNWYDIMAIENETYGTCYMYVQHGAFNPASVIKSGNWHEKL